jgi:beta-phosphoglucomutase family hydrolase
MEQHHLSAERIDAVLFDLDGVITDTVALHAAAWRQMLDDFLRRRAETTGEPFVPFDPDADYRTYIDGKPRYAGVRSFLAGRGIELPEGSPDDPPTVDTVHGLGNRKNDLVTGLIARNGVAPLPGVVGILEWLRDQGTKTALVSSSANAATVLEAAGIDGLFDARVDGMVASDLGLSGKPAADTYLEAARRLGADPDRSAVVEDAISGVRAGRSGGFGLVVGVGTGEQARALLENGADIVVADLGELLAGELT